MSSQPLENDDNPISLRRRSFIEAIKSGDVDGIVETFTDDAVYMPPNDTTLYGKAEIRAWHEEYREYFRVAAFNVPEQHVTIAGGWAVERSSYMIAIIPSGGGSRIRDDGRFVAIWKCEPGGSWRIWHQLWNSVKPVGIGTNRYMARLMQKKTGIRR
jgi:ketosteroid isomerase-like protein